MIDRTEQDVEAGSKKRRGSGDDDPHADHSLDPNEHYGQESDIPTEDQLREQAEPAS